MKVKKRSLILCLVGAAACIGCYWVLFQVNPARYDARFWFPAEPEVRNIETVSKDNPRLYLPDLLEEDWDYVCIVTPYYPLKNDPRLSGVDIPWTWDDGLYTIVLMRADTSDVHPVRRSKVVWFELPTMGEDEGCYDSTAVSIEYVDGDGPVTLRIVPKG